MSQYVSYRGGWGALGVCLGFLVILSQIGVSLGGAAEVESAEQLVGADPVGDTPVSMTQTEERRLGLGIPYSAVINDPGAPYDRLFQRQSFGIDPSIRTGPGGITRVELLGASAMASLDLPFIERGFDPDDAMLKIGPLYVDIRAMTAELLCSDNANQSEDSPEEGAISYSQLEDVTVVLQIAEGLRLAVKGDLIVLPFEADAGVQGFGATDPLGTTIGLDAETLFRAQLAYDGRFAGWDAAFIEDYRVEDQSRRDNLGAFLSDDVRDLQGASMDEVEQLGRYSFSFAGRQELNSTSRRRRRFGDVEEDDNLAARLDSSELRHVNTVGLALSRALPVDTRGELALFRTDYRYMDDDEGGRVDWRHGLSLSLVCERANLRFKPYVLWTVSDDSDDRGVTHAVRVGMAGPLTENMSLDANVGHVWQLNPNENDTLFKLALTHRPRMTTVHTISYQRGMHEPEGELMDQLLYRVVQGMGPRLSCSLSAVWRRTVRDTLVTGQDSVDEEWGIGVGGLFRPGERLALELLHTYTVSDVRGTQDYSEAESVTALRTTYLLTENLELALGYEFTDLDSTRKGKSYQENLLRVWVTYSF